MASLPCHRDDIGISTKNKSPDRSVAYNKYKECTFSPQASKRFPLWNIHPLEEKSTQLSHWDNWLCELIDMLDIMQDQSRTTRQVKFYAADSNYGTMLRFFDSNWVRMPNRVLPKLRLVRSLMIWHTRIEKPTTDFFPCKKNFLFNHIHDHQNVWVVEHDFD